MIKLSLGCGARDDHDGCIGYDCVSYGWNKIWKAGEQIDQNDDSVNYIKAWNFLEHLNPEEVIPTLNECWRVLKKGGILDILVPDISKSVELACADPTHKSFWVPDTFSKYLAGTKPQNANYGLKKWLVKEIIAKGRNGCNLYVKLNPNK